MPRIREYTTQTSAEAGIPGRRAQGSDFGGPGLTQIGNAMQGAGQDIGNGAMYLAQQEGREEVTDVHTQLAKANAEWTLHMNDRGNATAPGDSTFAPKFIEDFDNYINKLGENYTTAKGKRAFDQGVGQLRAHFIERAGMFQANLAGVHAKQQFQTVLDSSRNALVNDPSQFDRLLVSTHTALNDPEGLYAKIPVAQREPLIRMTKEQLAMSAVQGYINLSPQLALKQLQSGRWDEYLDADKRVMLERSAEVGIRGQEVEAQRVEAMKIKARKEEERATQENIVQAMANGSLTTKMIMSSNLPPTGEGSKEHFLNVLRTRSKENAERPIKTVPSVMLDLFTRVHLPDGDPRKITDESALNDAYIGKQLSFEDFSRLRKEVTDARTPDGEKLGKRRSDFVSGVSAQIDKSNPLMGKIDASGKQQVYEFSYYVDQQVDAYRKAGKNPYDLFDPSKPDYLGSPQVISGFQKTIQQSMKDYSDRIRRAPDISVPSGGVPNERVRKQGETIAQYLERTGGK